MSRLSSLLVRDGLVGVKRMEKAFQRQVIYGGSLDTILLEIGAVPEDRLTQYLALATGLPPAARDESRLIDPNAVALLSADAADQFHTVPLSIVADDALRVLVCAPLELTALEDLADLLDRPLQPLITPEYRWHLAFAAAYATEPPARFATLSRALEIEAPNAPVGRAQTIIIESQPPHDTAPLPMHQRKPARPAPPLVSRKVTPPMPTIAERPPATPATPVVAPVPDEAPTQPIGAIERGRVATLLGITAPVVDFTEPEITPPPAAPAPIAGDAGRAARIAIDGRDSPLAIVRARELLATARDRDGVFLTLLRAARARARYAGLMTVQGGAAIGRVALAEPGLETAAIASVLIPLDIVSPFRSVALNLQPHIGSLASYDAGITAMMSRFGGVVPPSALLMPILLRERCVAIVIAHRGHGELKLVDVAELLPLAAAAADALGRLIVVRKRNTPASGVPVIAVAAAAPAIGRHAEQMPVLPAALDEGPELTFATEPPRPIEAVLDEIEREREGVADLAIADALDRSQEAIGALMRRFPGTLRVERFAVTGRPLRAAQYGGLLELVVRLGPAATELLLAQLSSAQRDARFYATVCAIELRPPGALVALVEKVFDLDYGVRGAALEALAGYPPSELAQALARTRRAVHASDHEVVAAAMTAIVALGDVDAVGDLIATLERGDRSSELARRALVALTAQDFGSSERKWRKWWDGAKQKHRIQWLIDGLTHKDDAIRETAIGDLRRLTGEYFGYHHDLPRKDRDDAAERWAAWWSETGYRRFVIREDERLRPTAILPNRPVD